MRLLYDFFPILVFFAAYKLAGIYVATAAAIAATGLQVGLHWLRHRRVEAMHLVTLGLIVVFGGATLLLHDELYIKWKPTVLNWLFALAFLGSQLFGGRTLVERVMGREIALPPAVWRRLNLGWALFFGFVGALNLYVAYRFPTDVWVDFKLFGIVGLTLLFVVGQGLWLARHLEPQREDGA